MFTVFGATGNTGNVVANRLLEAGKKVRAAVHHKDKAKGLRARGAEVVEVDLLDSRSVASALTGADGAYLLVPPDLSSNDLVARGRRIVDAYVTGLRESRVPRAAVLSSAGSQHASGTGPIVITHYAEQELKKVSGTVVSIVRASYFMENLLALAQTMKQDGVLPVFGGGESFRFPWVATRDIGETAAAALLKRPRSNETIELSGPAEYSFEDAAAEATKILGRPVKVAVVPIDQMVPTLARAGMSRNVAELYREMTEAGAAGLVGFEGNHKSVRGKVTLGDFLRNVFA